jgi:hypothetical protein
MKTREYQTAAEQLLKAALASLHGDGGADAALHRLVDAAGLLACVADPSAIGQPNHPTSRGFEIRIHA